MVFYNTFKLSFMFSIILLKKKKKQKITRRRFYTKKIWIFTTDDSWSDTYTSLAPIARKYSIPFFFGAIENRVDTPGFITKSQLIELSHDPLFTLSSHSMTHSDHSKMDEKREAYEICTSKELFEKMS